MTDDTERDSSPDEAAPLDPWMIALACDVADRTDGVNVPSDLMWKRVQAKRALSPMTTTAATAVTSAVTPTATTASGASTAALPLQSSDWRRWAGIAAVLVGGIGIGRFMLPHPFAPHGAASTNANVALTSDSLNTPTRVAMDEHLARTVALLTAVRDRDAVRGADVSSWARELLGTTRVLLDEPTLRDEHTKQLLQDLELVLMQIAQARGTASPEAQRAPTETMRETNLLPRVRDAVSAAARRDEPLQRGADE